MSIYLDNSATSFPKPEEVYRAMDYFMRHNGASPGRGNYTRAMDADRELYETRKVLAKLFGIAKPGHIIFTANVTEALNLVLKGFLQVGDEVVTSNIEHNAMWRPLKKVEAERQVKVTTFCCEPDGTVNLAELESLFTPKTKLLALLHGSNVLGNIFPLEDIVRKAHAHGVLVLVDAAQTAGLMPIEVEKWGIDFFAFTGHKGLLGPTGTGGVYIGERHLNTLKEGGTGGMAQSPFQPKEPPDRFEAGTLNIAGLVGLKAAVNFLLDRGLDNILAHERTLTDQLMTGLEAIEGVEIYGPRRSTQRLGLVSFNLAQLDPYAVASKLDKDFGIMVRAGLHCAPQAHRLMGTIERGAVRAGVSVFNSSLEIEALLNALKKIAAA